MMMSTGKNGCCFEQNFNKESKEDSKDKRQQNKVFFLGKGLSFFSGISLHFRPFVVHSGFSTRDSMVKLVVSKKATKIDIIFTVNLRPNT